MEASQPLVSTATPPCVSPSAPRPVDPEWVLSRLKDPETLEKISSILFQRGISITKPILKLELEVPPTQPPPCLDVEDLKKLFSPFGTIENLVLQNKQKNAALVTYQDTVSAFLAVQSLNGYLIEAYNTRLSVKWVLSEENTVTNLETSQPLLQQTETQKVAISQEEFKGYYPPAAMYADQKAATMSKYTCRFDIQIENDKEFQVARKLIGAKGSNMKRIVDQCCKGCSCPVQEVIKLRLRGRGSGFKEGPHQQESNEPLHLCISTRYYEKYMMAKQMVRDLILDVYEDYKKYCERAGKEPISKLDIKLTENASGNRQRNHMKGGMIRPAQQMYYSNGHPGHPGSTTATPPSAAPYYYEVPSMPRAANPYYAHPAYPPYYAPQPYEGAEVRRPYPEHYGYPGTGYHPHPE